MKHISKFYGLAAGLQAQMRGKQQLTCQMDLYWLYLGLVRMVLKIEKQFLRLLLQLNSCSLCRIETKQGGRDF